MSAALELPRAFGSAADPVTAGANPTLIALAGVLLILAALGAMAAAALLIYSPTKLQLRLGNGRGQKLAEELEARDAEYQIVARFYSLGGLVAAFATLEAGVASSMQTWALVILAAVALFLWGVLPAAIAESRAEATVHRALPALRLGRWLLHYPMVIPIRAATRSVLRALRIREAPATDPEEIAEEVMAAVSDSVTQGTLQEEKRWIGNILDLKDQQVSEAMTPRTDIVAIPAGTAVRDAVMLALKHGFSRYPVYEGRIDEIVGVFYVKDALRLLDGTPGEDALDPQAPVRSMMREPLFVPETMAVMQLLRRFKADRLQMAIVLDEYGGTAGLISIEDILEEIVGDIDDEYDADEDESRVLEVEKGRIVELPARTRVEDVNAMLGSDLPEDDDYDTIAGCVISHLNRIPAAGETIRLDGVEIRILKADDRRLRRLRVTALEPQTTPEAG